MERSGVAIIGAGFSGTLLALHLARHCPPATGITLIERHPEFGPGLAYSTDCSDHLLNVPAGRMSAFQDLPSHFLEWLERQSDETLTGSKPEASSFVPRRAYGRYLRELLGDTVRGAPPGRLELVHGRIVAAAREQNCVTLQFEGGGDIAPAIAVLATGNHIPAEPYPALQGNTFYRNNPWAGDISDGLSPDSRVLLIGTGLTMVDTVLRLWKDGHRGPVHVLSRRGLLPRSHSVASPVPPGFDRHEIPTRLRDLVRFVRIEADRIAECGGSWHAVVDALRPVTQDIWRNSSVTERRRFLAHVRPWWDVYRHRLSPAIASRIDAARTRGQLIIHAGRIRGFAVRGQEADIFWQPKGTVEKAVLHVHRVINCSGPDTNIENSPDPLIRSLLSGGLGRPDPLRLGFDVAEDGGLVGYAADVLFGIGPVRRGALWETTAVPDIRVQCERLALHIAELLRRRETPNWVPAHVPSPHAALGRIPGLWY
jgi:uncharacterized NAD(P)/FAD-binding protein YdhS